MREDFLQLKPPRCCLIFTMTNKKIDCNVLKEKIDEDYALWNKQSKPSEKSASKQRVLSRNLIRYYDNCLKK